MRPAEPVTGLILSGGGARAAYQVGVLAAIAELLPPGAPNPFPVIVGTSAGAINAVSLASGAPRTSGPRYNVLPLSGRASVAIWCCAVIGRG